MHGISLTSEHAIRALTFLALHDGEGYFLAREMEAELDIPAPFLTKLLRPLVGRGMLASQRGRGGGFALAVAPGEVTLFEIVEALEHLVEGRRCFLGQAECSDERACPLHDTWKAVNGRMIDKLQKTTLQDQVRFCRKRPESGYPGPTP